MNVLGIESSGPIGSVAACADEMLVAAESLERKMEQGRMLVALMDRVITSAGWDKRRDLDLIAVSQGPGSYTGLRVGITCAKTLAMLLGRPLVGVCSLDAMAENAPAEAKSVLAAVDAKRGQVYAAAYERAANGLRRVLGPLLMTPSEALKAATKPVYALGDATRHYAAEFRAPGCFAADEDRWRIRAGTIARLGLALFGGGQRADPISLEPIYLRLAEAEEKRQARLAAQTGEKGDA